MEPETLSQSNSTEHIHPEAIAPDVPKLTRKQIGQLRRQYVTVVHGVVRACGHKAKFSATKQPTNNCVDCWLAFFMSAVDLEVVHKFLTEQGVKAFVARYGDKFVKNFHGFLSTQLLKHQ